MVDVEYTLVRFRKNPVSYKPHVESIKKIMKRKYIECIFDLCESCFCELVK